MKIVLQNLTKIFPSRNKKSGEEVVAVNNFDFTIPDGKLIGLLGPSGCGKSTTLYMISGLQKPSSGKIFFGEDDVTDLSTENRGIGLVFQIVDDVLDVTSTPEQLGKPIGSDSENGKTTFVTLYGAEGAMKLAHDLNQETCTELHRNFGEKAAFLEQLAQQLLVRKN
mgnify:CR=1 FL=1